MSGSWEGFVKENRSAFSSLTKEILEMLRPVREASKKISEMIPTITIEIQVPRLGGQLNIAFRNLPEQVREALISLAGVGWYLDPVMTPKELWDLKTKIDEGHIESVHNILVEHFSGRIDPIESLLSARYPDRRAIIAAAFDAHRQSQYVLSIPVFLAQADGICSEAVLGQDLFRRDRRKALYSELVKQSPPDSILGAVLSPIEDNDMPIWATNRSQDFDKLNRHLVMHGIALEYGTESNSLKSISLINYLASMVLPRTDQE